MKAPKFDYIRAESVDHALSLLQEFGDDARILAGGQSLMPTLNMRLSQPRVLIDINCLEALRGITMTGETVRIGALVRHAETAASDIIAEHLSLVAQAMPHIAHVAVRNRGTFGGSVALADPAAELPACLLALNGTVVLESVAGRREVAAEDFFKGLFETARQPNELLTEIHIPREAPGSVSVFLELSRRQGDFAIAGLACHVLIEGDAIAEVRLVCFASEDRPVLARGAMAAVNGVPWSDESRAAAIAALANDLDPMDNLQGSAAMKLHLQRVLTGRALDAVFDRARAA